MDIKNTLLSYYLDIRKQNISDNKVMFMKVNLYFPQARYIPNENKKDSCISTLAANVNQQTWRQRRGKLLQQLTVIEAFW